MKLGPKDYDDIYNVPIVTIDNKHDGSVTKFIGIPIKTDGYIY